MEKLEDILSLDPEQLISALPKYQSNTIREMLASNGDYLMVADNWLSTKPSNTVGFGGSNQPNIYREKILEELEKFICGDEKYLNERKQISSHTDKSLGYILGVITTAIGATLGTSSILILPVVVLLLGCMGKITLNGWCEARKTIRSQSVNDE